MNLDYLSDEELLHEYTIEHANPNGEFELERNLRKQIIRRMRPDWRDAEKELPEYGVYVLALSKFGYSLAKIGPSLTGKWHGVGARSITHWMPLPAAPTGGEAAV